MDRKAVWHIASDLMMVSNVKTAAQQQQLEYVAIPSLQRLPSATLPVNVAVVLVDLQLPGLDFDRLKTVLGSAAGDSPPLVCLYAQHVDETALARGAELGIGHVMTRGQVHRDIQRLFGSLAN